MNIAIKMKFCRISKDNPDNLSEIFLWRRLSIYSKIPLQIYLDIILRLCAIEDVPAYGYSSEAALTLDK